MFSIGTGHQIHNQGCTLRYWVAGDGPPILMIQGVGVHGSGWRPQVESLAQHFRCLWFDNRGIGLSQPAGTPVTVEQMSQDCQAIMDAEGWPAAHVMGHSLGGLVALHLGLTCRSRTLSLALLCTFGDGAVPLRMSGRMLWVGMRTRIGTRQQRRNAFLEMVMPRAALARADRSALARDLAGIFGHDLADQPPVVMEQLAAMRRYDARPQLGELAGIPSLVVTGDEDMIAPPWAGKQLAEAIPGARLVEFHDSAHGLPIHRASEVNSLLMEHFRAL